MDLVILYTHLQLLIKLQKIIDYLFPRNLVIQKYPLDVGFWFDDDQGNNGESFISFSNIGEIYLNKRITSFDEIKALYP